MRLDARLGDIDWDVFDVKTCREVKLVVWVDSDTAQWGRVVGGLLGWHDELVQEDRITIYPSRRLVLFNEVDLGDDAETRIVAVEKETT